MTTTTQNYESVVALTDKLEALCRSEVPHHPGLAIAALCELLAWLAVNSLHEPEKSRAELISLVGDLFDYSIEQKRKRDAGKS